MNRTPLSLLLSAALVTGTLTSTLAGCGGGDAGAGGSGGTGGSPTTTTTTTTVATSTGTGGSGTGGSGTGAGGDVVGAPGYVGLACDDDSQCGPEGYCVKATDFDGGFYGSPAGGYCTVPCQDPSECPDPGSDCNIKPSGEGECLLGCAWGTPEFGYGEQPLDPTKCHGREDLVCTRRGNGTNVCLPNCGSDSNCLDGKICHPYYSVCVDTELVGKVNGEECDVAVQDCAGWCLRVTGTKKQTICTSLCALGGPFEESIDCGGIESGWCIARGIDSNPGIGDTGYCVPSCLKQEDCRTPDFFCVGLLPASTGLCMPAVECATDADCSPVSKCTLTTQGSFCLSPEYPLGSLDPAAGSTGSGM